MGHTGLDKFLRHNFGMERGLSSVDGYVIPIAWGTWGALLLYADLNPVSAVIVFLGLAVILAAIQTGRRGKRNTEKMAPR